MICYFSAGSYDHNRPDASRFHASDKGNKMDGWDEQWIDIRYTLLGLQMSELNVRSEQFRCVSDRGIKLKGEVITLCPHSQFLYATKFAGKRKSGWALILKQLM